MFVAIISLIEANIGCDGNKYICAEQTESCRLMRGAWEADVEYIPELCTKRSGLSTDSK
jgi:hypothetical protein